MIGLYPWIVKILVSSLFCLRYRVQSASVDVAATFRKSISSVPLTVFHHVNKCPMSENVIDFLQSQPLFSFSMRNPGEEQHVLNFASSLTKGQFRGKFGASSVQNIDQVRIMLF